MSDASQQPQVESFGALKNCVAIFVDGVNSPKVMEQAGKAIVDTIRQENMDHLFRFGRKQAAAVALVAATQAVTLASDFYAVSEVQLIDFTDLKPRLTLPYIPWNDLADVEPEQIKTGTPEAWTSRNTFDDSQILLYPIPDAGAAASYKLLLTYFTRVEEPSADGDILDAPKEFSRVLCWGGRKVVAAIFDGNRPHRYQVATREYEAARTAFFKADRREPVERLRFRIPERRSTTFPWG